MGDTTVRVKLSKNVPLVSPMMYHPFTAVMLQLFTAVTRPELRMVNGRSQPDMTEFAGMYVKK